MAISQMMQHYLDMKEKYKDCVLFYRLGDFYEMFFDDAVRVSKLLDLTLTGKDCGMKERAPMCGVPFHAADTYIAKLVGMGEKVAICEQLSDPKAGKGLVERDVVRIVTAGTVIEESLLDDKKNNYISCAYLKEGKFALAWADITTGEFCVSEEESLDRLLSVLTNLSVAEVICNDELLFAVKGRAEIERGILPAFSCYLPYAFEKVNAERVLKEQFACASLSALGLDGRSGAAVAAGALCEYLNDTQRRALKNITKIYIADHSGQMKLDPIAVRNLDLIKNSADSKRYGSLLWLIDKTKTSMGARKLASMLTAPLLQKDKIEERLDAVEELFNATVVSMGIEELLDGVKDIERLTGRISNGNLQPQDALALSNSLSVVPSLKFRLAGFSSKLLKDISASLADPVKICELLDGAIAPNATTLKEGNYIKDGYNTELDNLRNINRNSKSVAAELEARERERTGIRTLKVGYNRVFGYYIEVSNGFKDRVPYDYERRQTLSTGERYTTEELKELERKILGSEDASHRLEEHFYSEIMKILERNIPVFQQISSSIALLDVLLSFSAVAKANRYCRPQILEEGALEITDGRHPVVEAISKERFVPNDCMLDSKENRTMIITGPNMAGKSTYLRQVALIVLMAQIGCFVPAKSAKIPLCDRIFTRIGASDNLILDQSTFMVEMTEVANIMRNATSKSLLILDEVGRGTSTYDGLSIAWSVIEYLTEKVRAKTFFATHYHELTELEGKLEGVKNYKISVKEVGGSIVFLRKILRGGASRSFGVEVASLAGIPEEAVSRAKKILKSLEQKDINGVPYVTEAEEPSEEQFAIEREIKEIDVNSLTPMQALAILSDWKEKLR